MEILFILEESLILKMVESWLNKELGKTNINVDYITNNNLRKKSIEAHPYDLLCFIFAIYFLCKKIGQIIENFLVLYKILHVSIE